jgi:hypothetical protein
MAAHTQLMRFIFRAHLFRNRVVQVSIPAGDGLTVTAPPGHDSAKGH